MSTPWENRVTLVKKLNVPINLVDGALKTGDLKNDIPDPAHSSWGGFLEHQVLNYTSILNAYLTNESLPACI